MSSAGPDVSYLLKRSASAASTLPLPARQTLASNGRLAYALFILVNVTLFVRPAEFLSPLDGSPIYAVLAVFALLAAIVGVLAQLSIASLIERPITACVVGLLFAVVLSHLTAPFLWGARVSGVEFVKVVLYYLLLVAVVDTTSRLRHFLTSLVALGVIVTGLAVLQYHGWINIPALAELEHAFTNHETGERIVLIRLVSTGIFNDPNDLCLLLILTVAACVYRLEEANRALNRALWIAPLLLFVYSCTLTHSRGGFLGILAATVVFITFRFGWRRGLPLASLALPVIFFVFAGRQTELGVTDGTAQERIQLWSYGLTLFRRAPFFGIGYGRFAEEIGGVAHNSFVHSFAELGFFGGTLFLGAFALAFRSVQRVGAPAGATRLDPELTRMRPYLLAIIAGYAVGMVSLSRTYVVPTYLILGLAAAYVEIARRQSPAVVLPRVGTTLVFRLATLSATFIACTYVFVRVFVRWS